MVLASCALTPPAISRIPAIHSLGAVYLGADLLVMVAMMYDMVLLRRVHAVYRWGFAIAVAGQTALLLVMADRPGPFVAFAHFVTG
jgi:cyanophycinase-like exopeptidase